MSIASVPAAIFPVLAFLWLMWWLDRYDREPVWLFAGTFLWGATGAVAIAFVIGSPLIGWSLDAMNAANFALFNMVLVAPLVEEPAKALVLLLVFRSSHFDNTTDGFVYGAAAGLGFGMTENLVYFISAADGGAVLWVGTVVTRTLYSALMHACATSLVGAALGYAKFHRGPMRGLALPLGLFLAICMHGLWNLLLTAGAGGGVNAPLAWLDLLLFPLEFLVLFAIFQLCLLDEWRLLSRELKDEAQRGTLPAEHVRHLVSFTRRQLRGWLPGQVDHGEYVRAATTLAFRKVQLRTAEDRRFYEAEVERLRAEIATLLG